MALVDKLGLSIFVLWWAFAIWFSDGACPMDDACSDLNFQAPAAIWIAMRLVHWGWRSRRLARRAPQYWRTRRDCARFSDAD
jgi:hypothetical protein